MTFIICSLFLSQSLSAQTPVLDNLKNILPSLKGTERVDCLNELGSELSDRYWSKSKYQQTDSAFLFTMKALEEAKQLQYIKGTGRAYQNLGYIEEEHGNLKTAEDYTRKALAVLEKENMETQHHRCRVFLGWILHNRGFSTQGIRILKQELPYYKTIKDSVHIAAISRMIARAYMSMGNSEDAFTYFQQDFAIQKTPQDAWGKRSSATLKATVYLAAGDTVNASLYYKEAALASIDQRQIIGAYYGNMATAYALQKKYDSALLLMRKRHDIIKASTSDSLFRKVELMVNYNELSGLFVSLKEYDSAISYARQSSDFFRNGDYMTFLMPALRTMAAVHYAKHQNAAALNNARQLLAYAKKSGARPFERDAYKLLWQIYSVQHKSIIANSHYLKYILLNDSLQNDKYISQALAWKAINDIQNYRNQLQINEERHNTRIKFIDNEKKVQSYVFISAIVLISLFTLLIIRNSRLRRKRDQLQLMMTEANIAIEKQKREQEVTRLQQQKADLEMYALRAQMNPHFIFNCLSSINRFILNNKMEEASDYLTKFSLLIRLTLQNSEKSFIALENELESLRLYLELEKLRFKSAFDYNISFKNNIDASTVFTPPLLIQPFTENAIWHGLMHKEGKGNLDITLEADDEILTCEITDNGIGRSKAAGFKSKSAEKNKAMGIQISAKRLALLNRENNGNPSFDIIDLVDSEGYSCGTKIVLKIKYKHIADAGKQN
ncbi:MAG: histidine kinase [Terrimonas sp.]|nr:histidine kinase [Terrimonas sp.]